MGEQRDYKMSYGGNKEEDPYWRRKNRVADDADSIGGVSATSHRRITSGKPSTYSKPQPRSQARGETNPYARNRRFSSNLAVAQPRNLQLLEPDEGCCTNCRSNCVTFLTVFNLILFIGLGVAIYFVGYEMILADLNTRIEALEAHRNTTGTNSTETVGWNNTEIL